MKTSKTPRTDAAEKLIARGKIVTVRVEFAQELEVEIIRLKESLKKKQAVENSVETLKKTISDKDREIEKLRNRASELADESFSFRQELKRVGSIVGHNLSSQTSVAGRVEELFNKMIDPSFIVNGVKGLLPPEGMSPDFVLGFLNCSARVQFELMPKRNRKAL